MGEYTRTYRYTGRSNTSAARSVSFSSFNVVSGDTTHDVARVLGIQYSHWHTSTNPYTWTLRGRLVLADGTTFISDTVSKKIEGDIVRFTNTFTDLPDAEQFAQLQKVQTLNNQGTIGLGSGYSADLYWRADSSHPMDIILTFSDVPDVQASGISSVNSITLNGSNAVKVVMNKLSERARHTVTWTLGSYSYTSGMVDTEASYAPPLTWLNAIPNSRTGTGTVTVKTYADTDTGLTQQIGASATASFTVTAPDSARPTVGAGWVSAAPYNTGQAAGLTNYIQGYSRVKLTFDATKINCQYGAAVSNYSYTVQNTTVTASDHVSGLLKTAGTSQIVVTVTDTRGLTNDITLSVAALSIAVQAYAEPKLSNVTVLRSENNGAPTDGVYGDSNGSYIYAKATAVVTAAVGLQSLVLMYRQKGTVDYTTVSLTSGTAAVVSGLDTTRIYEAVVMVTDKLSNSYSQRFTLLHGQQVPIKLKNNEVRFGWKPIFEIGFQSFEPVLPVGACVMLASDIDPVDAMGGTWEQISWSSAPEGVLLWKRTT